MKIQIISDLHREFGSVLRSQNATLEQGRYSKYLPFAFTEHGILMLSNVLKTEQAIKMSIRIIFPKGSVKFDNALLMTNIEHEWGTERRIKV